jgi:hypothetical protein
MKKENKKSKEEFVKLYVPELRQLVESGDEKMCLVMAQCEYWFGHKPDGFYKFMSPAKGDNAAYREGDSWTEEMGMSNTKIANALKPICTHYPSFTAYKNEAGDKFKGRFYCSYYHKPSHQTHYLRDHDRTNAALKSLSLEKRSPIFREKHSSKVRNGEKDFSGDTETGCPEIIEAEVVYTENTTKTTQESSSDKTQEREDNSHFSPDEINKEEEIKKEEEIRDAMKEEEAAEVYEPSGDSVDSLDNRNSVVNAKNSWQSPQKYPVPFPADFELTEEMIAWAESNKPEIDVHESTKIFKIHHADNVSEDWSKKWKSWIMRERTAKGTTYAPKKPSKGDVYRELARRMIERENSEQSEQAVNEPEPDISKTISPEIRQIRIPNSHADAIAKVSYDVKPYLMHRDSLYAAYEDGLSKSNNSYSQQTFDEGLKYLCGMRMFQSYFKDYYINLFEFKKSADWMALTDKEILEADIETYKEIINFITERVLVLDDVVEEQFSNINVKELQLFINAAVTFKLLGVKNHYICNFEQYNSNPGYKEEVDKKLKEKGLLDNQ